VEVVRDTIFVNRGYLNILIKGHNSGTPLLKVCHALYLDMRSKLLIKMIWKLWKECKTHLPNKLLYQAS